MRQVIIIDNSAADRQFMIATIAKTDLNLELTECSDFQSALAEIQTKAFDCAILDFRLLNEDDLANVARLQEIAPSLPVVVITEFGNEEVASSAIKSGAIDYINKSRINVQNIQRILENAFHIREMKIRIADQQSALQMFARVLVHDLKNPIQSIFGNIRLMEAMLQKPDLKKEALARLAQNAAKNTTTLVDLIDSLHRYTQTDQNIALRPMRLGLAVDDAAGSLERLISRRKAHIDAGSLPEIMGDRPRLGQLFQNLIANSIKFCRDASPVIRISAGQEQDGLATIEVCDNGIGIPREELNEIFEPFKRLNAKDEYEGAGLGLATCRKIVQQHGGTIWCESESGNGSKFKFTLRTV